MRVLVVEDEPVLRSQLVRSLRDENHAVDSACDGEEGLYKILNGSYELVILDVMMPKMDGFEVLQRMRTSGASALVLMLTACDAVEDRIQGLDIGADDYLVKPFDLAELKARVRSLLRRMSQMQSNSIVIGEVELNLTQNKVFMNGCELDMTGREFGITEVLFRKKGSVVSRSELYENVVDETDDSMSNLLDVHICSIRKKLGKELIRTVRGRGYIVE